MRLTWYLFAAALLALGASATSGQEVLRLLREIPLLNVKGRIDHMDIDSARGRLYVAANGNNSLEVVDLRQGVVIRSIGGFDEPQGVAYLPGSDRIVVTNGGDGSVRVLDGSTFAEVQRIALSDDADNIRFEPSLNRIFVGFGSGGIAVVDGSTFDRLSGVKLPGHPESFQLAAGGKTLAVNIPGAREINILDLHKSEPVASIVLTDEGGNFPMAIDEGQELLFVGCRRPPRLLAFDMNSRHRVYTAKIGGDVDDIFCDPDAGRLFLSCGEGVIDVLGYTRAGCQTLPSVPTARGARTCLFSRKSHRLYLAIPGRSGRPASIRVYGVSRGPDAPRPSRRD